VAAGIVLADILAYYAMRKSLINNSSSMHLLLLILYLLKSVSSAHAAISIPQFYLSHTVP